MENSIAAISKEELLNLQSVLQIRYVKLHFTLTFPDGGLLPRTKASALRGGIGEMLMRANCIRDRACDQCDFKEECLVQRTMYSRFEYKPAFVTTGDSVGYVVECEDYRESVRAGDTIQFNLLLFGKTIVYFSQYAFAINALGQQGIGREHTRFYVSSITNTEKVPLLRDGNILMAEYRVRTVGDYVNYRLDTIQKRGLAGEISFKTPLSIKHQGEWMQSLDMAVILKAIQRRIYMLDCFEGIEAGENFYRMEIEAPVLKEENRKEAYVARYSFRKEQKMYWKGIEGSGKMESVTGQALLLLLAGELIHIGKNSSFGFGRYHLR